MKKVPFALILAFGLASGSAFAASNGVITITGQVNETSCNVAVADQLVELAPVSIGDLTDKIGVRTAPKRFTLNFAGCPPLTDISTLFTSDDASGIDITTQTLVNKGGATNVNIALYKGTERIKLGQQDANAFALTTETTDEAGNATFTYVAAYYPVAAVVESGSVNVKTNYIITYK